MNAVSPSPAVCFAALMPHAPVLVPAVAGGRCREVAATVAAMREVAGACVRAKPQTVVVVSPHSPRWRSAFGVWAGARVAGSLGQFGASRVAVDFPADAAMRDELAGQAGVRGLRMRLISPGEELDHGAVVPLWFLAEAGWRGAVLVLGLSDPSERGCAELGQAIAGAAGALARRTAVIASGDMSHRLLPGAPAGYHPRARDFDRQFIAILRDGDRVGLTAIDPELLERAAEDVVDSTVVAWAAAGWRDAGRRVLSYEGPFGVGYGVAVMFAEDGTTDAEAWLPEVARQSLKAAFGDQLAAPPVVPAEHPLAGCRAGVFVTLRDAEGELRGCVGTIEPQAANVVAETWENARAAAFRDTRFVPVEAREIDCLAIEVSVLERPEAVDTPAMLDPAVYGVVMIGPGGRRSQLLPGIPGIETVAEQLAVVRRKAGIGATEPVRLQRFRVKKFGSPPAIHHPQRTWSPA